MEEKKRIYYARPYRRIKVSLWKSGLYLLVLVAPLLALLVMNIDVVTGYMCQLSASILRSGMPGAEISAIQDEFSILGDMYYLDVPNALPATTTILINLVVCFLMVGLVMVGRNKGKPLAIFIMLSTITHLINCLFFLFGADWFPYTVTEYSELYMKQQIGIWIVFMLMSGLVTGTFTAHGWLYKGLMFLGINAYSLVFGLVRYILFLFLLSKFSVIYMALMFFVFGPLLDFSYFVAIYAIFADKMTKLYEYGKERRDWQWL